MDTTSLFPTAFEEHFRSKLPQGWTVCCQSFVEPKRIAKCVPMSKTIEISTHVWETKRLQDVMRILAHEVAHALVFNFDHGAEWKQKSLELGGTARTKDYIPMPYKKNALLYCVNCLIQDELSPAQEVTNEIEIEYQKRAIDTLRAKGVHIDEIMKMYMEGFCFTK